MSVSSGPLGKWRDELEELNQRIEKGTQARSATPQALIQLARLTRHADQHLETDALRLSQALSTVIDRVYVGRRIVEGNGTLYVKDSSYREVYGEIHFSRAVYDGPPIDFTEVDLGIRRVWRDVANYVAGQARPVLSNEVCRQFGFTQSIACRHLAKGVTAGIIKRVGPHQGWIAASLKA